MLSYEEELQLSDLLVARREVREALKADDRKPTREERRVIKRGDDAATTLVENYVPLIRSIASSIIRKTRSDSPVSYDDLISEGTIAAMVCCNSFNARGTGERRGRRFSTYSSMAISKAMNRHVAKMSTPLRMDITVIQKSWTWLAVRDELTAKLRRTPTDEEIEEQVNISSSEVSRDIPHYAEMSDIDNPDLYNDPGVNEVVDIISDIDANNAILSEVLTTYVADELYEAYMTYLGLDLGYPRSIKETAKEIGTTQKWTREMVNSVNDIIRHPHYRLAMARKLDEMGWKRPSED